jgi:UDP-N-acetylglucosamine pyrophosphorylase
MAPKKDRQRTFEEYEAERQQERNQWIHYKKCGLTRKMYCETLDYERNKKALEEDDDLNAEEMEKLIINIWVYEQNLAKWEMEERIKMENWFCNFEQNNPDFVQKIQEQNYCLAETIIQAIMD